MFNEATFGEILLPSWASMMSMWRISIKNRRVETETIEFADMGEIRKVVQCN